MAARTISPERTGLLPRVVIRLLIRSLLLMPDQITSAVNILQVLLQHSLQLLPAYTSNADGFWSDNTIWTQTGGDPYPCPAGGPNGFIVNVNHVVTINANNMYGLQDYYK